LISGVDPGDASGARPPLPPYLQPIFEIDRNIFKIGKSFEMGGNFNVKRPTFPQILDPPLDIRIRIRIIIIIIIILLNQ
jgi:hypothetical protein